MRQNIFRIIIASLMAASLVAPAARAAAKDADGLSASDKNAIAAEARRVLNNLDASYLYVARDVSPARLPDELAYALHKPLDVDISFPMDGFKQDYCTSIPAYASVARVDSVRRVSVSNGGKTVRRNGVLLRDQQLKRAVIDATYEFESVKGKDRYKYVARIRRFAVVEIDSELGFDEGRRVRTTFELKLAEYGAGDWKLHDIKRRDYDAKGNEIKTIVNLKPSPFYEDCVTPD